MNFDTASAWGTWKPRGAAATSLGIVAALPRIGIFRRLAFLLRKPVKSGKQEFYDREIWGLRLRLSTRGNLTEQRWLTMEQFHDWPEREALRQQLGDKAVFLDVGANVGFYTFWALAQKRPGLRVVAVEPSSAMVERLRYNLALNGLESAVRVQQCAVTATPGEVMIEEHAHNLGQTTVHSGGAGQRVPGRPLLDIVAESGVTKVDALKIDIEGQEIPVLEAFFTTAPRLLWPRLLIGEIVGESGNALKQLMIKQGYTLERATKMNGIFRLS